MQNLLHVLCDRPCRMPSRLVQNTMNMIVVFCTVTFISSPILLPTGATDASCVTFGPRVCIAFLHSRLMCSMCTSHWMFHTERPWVFTVRLQSSCYFIRGVYTLLEISCKILREQMQESFLHVSCGIHERFLKDRSRSIGNSLEILAQIFARSLQYLRKSEEDMSCKFLQRILNFL